MEKLFNSFYEALLAIENMDEAKCFFDDLCTPQELEEFAKRWQVVDELHRGLTYREINQKTKVSTTTITRIAKHLKYGNDGYKTIYHRLHPQHRHQNDKDKDKDKDKGNDNDNDKDSKDS